MVAPPEFGLSLLAIISDVTEQTKQVQNLQQ